jgi:hypothetical protein
MKELRNAYKILAGKHLAQDTDHRRALDNTVMNIRVPGKAGN